jgi:hypothetical protein
MMSTYNPYSTSMQTLFIEKIIKTALEFLDDTPFKLGKGDKDKALSILKVNTNANGGSRAGRDTIVININGWQKQNVKNGKVLLVNIKSLKHLNIKKMVIFIC